MLHKLAKLSCTQFPCGAIRLVTRMASPHPSTSLKTVSRDNAKPMEPCLAGDGRWDGSCTGLSISEKVTATKMLVGREACIERIYYERHENGECCKWMLLSFFGHF